MTFHTYTTSLNETEAKSVRQLPFISICMEILPGGEDDGESGFRAINQSLARIPPKFHKRDNKALEGNDNLGFRDLSPDPSPDPSPDHPRIISSKDGGPSAKDYLFDQTLGKGITIYIIDNGCRIGHQVCQVIAPITFPH